VLLRRKAMFTLKIKRLLIVIVCVLLIPIYASADLLTYQFTLWCDDVDPVDPGGAWYGGFEEPPSEPFQGSFTINEILLQPEMYVRIDMGNFVAPSDDYPGSYKDPRIPSDFSSSDLLLDFSLVLPDHTIHGHRDWWAWETNELGEITKLWFAEDPGLGVSLVRPSPGWFAGHDWWSYYGDLPQIISGHADFNAQPIPEPSTVLLIGIGLIGLAGYGRKKLRKISLLFIFASTTSQTFNIFQIYL